ncbi:MAG: hypothetical protein WBW04_19255 [Nitrolancea sp.]
MSCYTRHLEAPMWAAGLAFDPAGKREADRRIRAGLKMIDEDCPVIWARLKQLSAEEILDLLRVTEAG